MQPSGRLSAVAGGIAVLSALSGLAATAHAGPFATAGGATPAVTTAARGVLDLRALLAGPTAAPATQAPAPVEATQTPWVEAAPAEVTLPPAAPVAVAPPPTQGAAPSPPPTAPPAATPRPTPEPTETPDPGEHWPLPGPSPSPSPGGDG